MLIKENISLLPYNTFGINVIAKKFVEINSIDEIYELENNNLLKNIFVIGGGSNMLLTKNIDKLVLKLNLKGKDIINCEENNTKIVKASASEDWPSFVLWSIDNGLNGLENLSKIPGNVGTSPIQNIGAYGTEVKDYFYKLEAFEISTGKIKTFYKQECEFGYRESIFKNSAKNEFIILDVFFKLKTSTHLNINYGIIKNKLSEKNISNPTAKDVSNCIIEIRESKLPDPKNIGNSGSFFKNPVIEKEKLDELLLKHSDIPFYSQDNNLAKIPAGWLIEKLGWKGYRKGDAGVHENQALVLVNYGNASGLEILHLSKKIISSIEVNFGITLEIEVNII